MSADTPTLPKVSRLILGDNPIYGYSHFNQLLSEHQKEANTPDQVMATLRRAEEVGVNTWQNTITERSAADLRRCREEGGTIQWLCLSRGSQWYEDPDHIDEAAKLNPIGMAPHGSGVCGRCLRENRLDYLQDILKRIRDTGVLVGLSAHDPRLVEISEEQGWDVDYYMTAFYNLAGARKAFEKQFGHLPLSEVYLRQDRDRMCGVILQASKPCIAYKVLAAGRAVRSKEQISEEIGFALDHIKPGDALLVGMYQKFGDQLGENAARVAELCNA